MRGLSVACLVLAQLALSASPETNAAETAKGVADDADLDLDDLENDDEDDLDEVDGASAGEPEADDFDKDMPEEDRTMRMKICLAGAMARLHTHSEEVSQLAAQLAERGLNKQQAMNSIFYTWMITMAAVQETEKRDSESARPPGSQAMERVRRTRWSKWSRCCKAGCLVWLLAALESTKSESFAGPRRALLAALPFFSSAKANAEVTIAPTQLPPRDARKDEEFAKGMAYGMVDYERAVSKKKRALFSKLWGLLPPNPVVVEVGIGSFPNALYFGSKSAPSSMDIVGVDPNEYMERYAIDNAKKVGLLAPERGNSFRFTKGIAEALPLPGQSADAVICTLTLCSVANPDHAVSEIRRVLKPGGYYLFVEHVLSETNGFIATAQKLATPDHVLSADGCHFDRRTLQNIEAGGFAKVDGEYFELECYVKIPDADAKAAADGNSDVLKDAQLYEPPAKASNRQWSLLETVLKEHMEMQQEALKKQEEQKKAQSQSQQSRNAGQTPQERPAPSGSGSKLYMLVALGFIFGVIGLGIMLLMQKERSERDEKDRKKDKKASKKKLLAHCHAVQPRNDASIFPATSALFRIMSNSLASARVASAGQAMPLEAARNRSTAMMHKLHVLEDKYVKDWSQRIDLEVRSKGDMGQHVVQAQHQWEKSRETPIFLHQLAHQPKPSAQTCPSAFGAMALLLPGKCLAEKTLVPQHPTPERQSLLRTSKDPRLPRSWLLAAVPLTAATCRASRHRCQTLRRARAPEADSETPRRVALTVLGTALTATGVDAALRASDERYAALGTILAPAPYKETLRTELVPGRIWGFEQCIALASVSTNIRMTAVKLRNGGLWVSAPIAPTRQCLRLLDELGKVSHLVIPSTALEHKASLAEFSRTYPQAEIWVTPGQAPPITVPSNSRILGQGPAPVWADELDCKVFYVSPPVTDTFAEAVFFHKESRSLLVTDCALKLPAAAPKILESYGYDGTPGPISLDQWRYKAIAFDFVTGRNQDEKDFAALSRPAALVNPLLRFIVYRRCPEQAAAWVKDVARWPFVRIIPAHLQAPFDCTPAQFLEAFGFLFGKKTSWEPEDEQLSFLRGVRDIVGGPTF
ncbi:Methyltransferase-like protein 7B [Symbiodinium microadriaticum]|uniref:Methyltransferase-like protein 7B n=1 Tax=Symbiodinium microadriaticum TaxID=2951 RepID=A0A1Q9D3E9_SYMMI|nr:Methyltransferase-like protein 7B [Symbiodinium microadriaticum]